MDDQNLDRTYHAMVNFRDELIRFDESLKASLQDLDREYEAVSPLWQDEMRKAFDRQWDSFRTTIRHYVQSEGPGFVEFLSIRIHKIGMYLRGDAGRY